MITQSTNSNKKTKPAVRLVQYTFPKFRRLNIVTRISHSSGVMTIPIHFRSIQIMDLLKVELDIFPNHIVVTALGGRNKPAAEL